MTLFYHEREKPIPAGWRFVCVLPGHHGRRYVLIERDT